MSSRGLSTISSAFGFGSDDTSIGTSIHGSRSLISFDSAGAFPRASGQPQEAIVRHSIDDDASNQDERPQLKRNVGIKHPRTPSLRTTSTFDWNTRLENPVKEAITNMRAIAKPTKSGAVSAGTLEGLVEQLITSFSAPYLDSSVSTLTHCSSKIYRRTKNSEIHC